jgi:hypothetical protein
MSVSSVGPVTYVLANFPNYTPHVGFAYFPGLGILMTETNGQMLPSMLKIISLHASFWDWVALQFEKLALVFHWYEIPNNTSTYLPKEYSMVLNATFLPFSFIAALGLTGLIFSFRQKKSLNLLFGILSQVVVMVAFYVLCRFRIPMVAMLAVYAGFSLQLLLENAWNRKFLMTLVSFTVLWLLIMRPTPKIPLKFDNSDLAHYFHSYYLPRLNEYSSKGDLASCAVLLEKFISSRPEEIKGLPGKFLTHRKEKELATYYSKLYKDLADLYRDLGQQEKAQVNYAESEVLERAGQQ